MLKCQLLMESQGSKYIESIKDLYTIFPAPWVPVLCSGISSFQNSVHLYEEFSCALCYQDIIQHGYKMNDAQTLACSKHPPNFRTISILLPETQVPQSCPLWVNSTDPHSFVINSTQTITISPGVVFRHNCMVSLQKYIKLGSRRKLGDGKGNGQ